MHNKFVRAAHATHRCLVSLILLAVGATASAEEIAGFIAADLRAFPNEPAFPAQDRQPLAPSLILQPEYRQSWGERDRLTIIPFARLDHRDDERTHLDLREFNWQHLGPDWDLRVGLGKVFWGVTESRHLVDIVNQTDRVEDIDEKDKLGQPMVNLNLIRHWGNVNLFILPGFRERTFPGPEGRLGFGLPVDTHHAIYESGLGERHVDVAARFSRALGDWDIGIADFWGTSREPRLIPALDSGGAPVLVPHYDIIHQTSIDVQATKGSWQWKLEAMSRSGQGDRFTASTTGFEYTLARLFDTNAELGLLAEYLHDGRDANAPFTPFNDDVYAGFRIGLNDTQNSELLLGATTDRHTHATSINLEAGSRLGDGWYWGVNARAFVHIPTSDILYSVAQDDFIQFRIKKFF